MISHPQPIGVIWRLAAPAQPRVLAPTVLARFGWVRTEEAAALAQAMDAEAAPRVAQRLAAGRRCCAAWANGLAAAWGWVSFETENVGELGLQLHLQPGEAYIWDCATVPEYRRRGLYAALLAHMARALLAEGVQTIWIGADYNNAPSQAGIGSAGFSAVAEIAAAPPQAGERRQLASLEARPGISPQVIADARRVYFAGREEAWLFEAGA